MPIHTSLTMDVGTDMAIEVFVNITNLTFLSFFYKISIEVSWKNKVASSGTWTHCYSQQWPSLVYKSDAGPTVLSRHVLTVSDFHILIKSCSIESRNDPSPKSEVVHETKFSLKISYSTHACLALLDQTCKPVMVTVVSSSPTGGNFIF